MKTNLITLLFLVVCNLANAQSWVRSNPVWHYDYWGVAEGGFIRIAQNGDTLVAGKQCQRLVSEQHTFYVAGPNGGYFHVETMLPDRFTYMENDTVYYWDNGNFSILCDFTATTGDSWLIQSGTEMFMCNDSSYTIVESTGTVNLGSEVANSWVLRDSVGGTFGLSGPINSHFGAMGNYLFPTGRNCDPGVIVDFYAYSFCSFQDDSLDYNPSGEDCEYMLTHLGVDNHAAGRISIYPNPASEWVLVETGWEEGSFDVLTTSGQVITSGKLDQGNLFMNTGNFSNGLYLVSLKSGSGANVVERFVIEH